MAGDAESGGEATLASCWDALGARKLVLEALEWSRVITLGSGSGELWREPGNQCGCLWIPLKWAIEGWFCWVAVGFWDEAEVMAGIGRGR